MMNSSIYYSCPEIQLGELFIIHNRCYVQLKRDPTHFFQKTLPPIPNTLYHYTSLDSFRKIINSREFWLMPMDRTNDEQEAIFIDQFLNDLCIPAALGDPRNQENLRINVFNMCYQTNKHKGYIASLTPIKEQSSKWSTYGDNATGICIGFSSQNLTAKHQLPVQGLYSVPQISILKVGYDENDAQALCKEIIERVKTIDPACIHKLALYLCKMSYILKNPGFSDEQEWRLLCCHVNTKDQIAPAHIPYNLNQNSFSEIIIGHHCDITADDIKEELMRNALYNPDIKIYKSKVPLRKSRNRP